MGESSVIMNYLWNTQRLTPVAGFEALLAGSGTGALRTAPKQSTARARDRQRNGIIVGINVEENSEIKSQILKP